LTPCPHDGETEGYIVPFSGGGTPQPFKKEKFPEEPGWLMAGNYFTFTGTGWTLWIPFVVTKIFARPIVPVPHGPRRRRTPTWTGRTDWHLHLLCNAEDQLQRQCRHVVTTMGRRGKTITIQIMALDFYDNKDFPFELVDFFGFPAGVITYYL
jgi:hypothetical protein